MLGIQQHIYQKLSKSLLYFYIYITDEEKHK